MTQAGWWRVLDAIISLKFISLPNLLTALHPEVYTTSNRKEYQKHKSNISGEKSGAGS
jgi:hypothetical protein